MSPHEFLQAVINTSNRQFTADQEADPVQFWTWLLNALHLGLTGGKHKKSSIITKCFQVLASVTTVHTCAPLCSCMSCCNRFNRKVYLE